MSYRSRLTLFFVLIVIVPMAAVTGLVLRLSSESRTGKADVRVAANLQTALAVYREEHGFNAREAADAARDRDLRTALQRGNRPALKRAVARVSREHRLVTLSVTDPRGTSLASEVSGTPVATAQLALNGPSTPLGTVAASGTAASTYLQEVRRLTSAEAILSRKGSVLLATHDADSAPSDSRRRSVELEPGLSVAILNPRPSAGLINSQPLLITVLALFFALAMALILPLLRDLQRFHGLVEQQAVTDELTGLSNQRGFRTFIDKEVERAKRFDRPLSLLMLDLDDFKGVNDTYGHPQGDRVLAEVARLLQVESRAIDEPARYGGEEFAIALPETTAVGALELAERVRKRIASTPIPLVSGEGTITVHASIGVAGTPATDADANGLVAAADEALYEAKRAGKNRSSVAGGASEPAGAAHEARKKAPERAQGT